MKAPPVSEYCLVGKDSQLIGQFQQFHLDFAEELRAQQFHFELMYKYVYIYTYTCVY